MRILLYNWAPAFSPAAEGGGVGLYLENLARSLSAQGHEVFALSSGYVYSLFFRGLTIRRRKVKGAPAKLFDVVNSPVGAPSFVMFPDAPAMLECAPLVKLFGDFLRRHGPFDVVHLQNIEGISFDVLGLAEAFPATRFILTNHNYHLVCQQANLWFQDKERCTDYEGGARCHVCNRFGQATDEMVVDRQIKFRGVGGARSPLRRLAWRGLVWVQRLRRRLFGPLPWDLRPDRTYQGRRIGPADAFVARRRVALDLANRHCAAVLSVSKATENILLSYGLAPERSRVSYIGTRHYQPDRPVVRTPAKPYLRLAFLGYTRPDKGFQFLVEAIARMPDRLRGCFSLLVAARISDPAAVGRLTTLQDRLARLDIVDGYQQAALPEVLSQVDLGLVLPQWDDALPQVAIEFVCHGVPILVSDRGGQQELAGDAAFIYPAEDVDAFWARLETLWRDHGELERFWTLPRPLRTTDEHAAELVGIYEGG